MKRLTKEKLLAFAKEEKKTAKEYKLLGFKKQGGQETEHSRFFKKKAKYWK